MTPLWRLASTQGLVPWKASPFTLGDLVSNLVSMVVEEVERCPLAQLCNKDRFQLDWTNGQQACKGVAARLLAPLGHSRL